MSSYQYHSDPHRYRYSDNGASRNNTDYFLTPKWSCESQTDSSTATHVPTTGIQGEQSNNTSGVYRYSLQTSFAAIGQVVLMTDFSQIMDKRF
jgi:hypothetical protein